MRSDRLVFIEDYLENETAGGMGGFSGTGGHRPRRNEELFDKVKVKLVMRINGITAEEARKTIASMMKAAQGADNQ